MKLAFKIMAAVMIVIAVLLVIHSYLVVKREVALFRSDMDLRAYLLGSVLASSVADIWKTSGLERAENIIEEANQSEHLIQVRLVWIDAQPDDPSAPRVSIEKLDALYQGEEILFPEYSYAGLGYHIAYFPVSLDSTRLSALELSQPLAPMHNYIRTTVVRKIVLFIAFLLVGGVFIWWLGIRIVGTPLRIMVDQAHSVGRGDLTAGNDLEHLKDEIGKLAQGLNDMVHDLRLSRTRLEDETSKRIAVMEQLNHAERLATVGKLASGLAHELGTPLNVVAGRAKMIVDEDITIAEKANCAIIIKNQAERMTGIIRQLLDFARSKSQEKTKVILTSPVESVIRMLSSIATEKKVEFDVQIEEKPPHVEIDVAQLQQVLSNLIVNAFHAMPHGGKVIIRGGRKSAVPPASHGGPEATYAFIDVIDNGVGIPPENLSRIFTPFFSTKQVGEGTGLGLSIVHGIMTEHRGWLTVDSKVGKGSTFTIYLPIEENK